MDGLKITHERLLAGIAFLLALFVRIFNLAFPALNDSEASLALQGFQILRSSSTQITAAPVYLAPTTILFFLFGASTFLARLVPALAGSFICLFPYLLRKKIGNLTAILAFFFLALDPFSIHLSRSADPAIIGITSALFLIVCVLDKKPIGIGIFLAGLLSSGAVLLPILLCFTLGFFFYLFTQHQDLKNTISDYSNGINWRLAFFSFVICFFVLGTVFFTRVNAITGSVMSLVAYFAELQTRLQSHNPTQILLLLFGLLVFAPLGIFMGISGMLSGFKEKNRWIIFLFFLWLVCLIITLINPTRRVVDLALSMIPLWLIAAKQITGMIKFPKEYPWITMLFLGFSLLLLLFIWLKVENLLLLTSGTADQQLSVVAILGSLVVLIITSLMVGWGWSWQISKFGLTSALLITLAIFTHGMIQRTISLDNDKDMNFLHSNPTFLEADLLLSTIEDISNQNHGIKHEIDISIVNYEKPSMIWLLRDFNHLAFQLVLPPNDSPSLVITNAQEVLQAPSEYRGQDFSWGVSTPWSLLSPNEWAHWLAFGDVIEQQDSIILWARNDLFPLYSNPEEPTNP